MDLVKPVFVGIGFDLASHESLDVIMTSNLGQLDLEHADWAQEAMARVWASLKSTNQLWQILLT